MKDKSRANKRIRLGDEVIALRGNEKGRSGKVLRINGDKAVVQGLNLKKKHVRRSEQNPRGGVVEYELPIHLSNLRLVVGDSQPVKLKVRLDEEKNKQLYYVDAEGKSVDHRPVK